MVLLRLFIAMLQRNQSLFETAAFTGQRAKTAPDFLLWLWPVSGRFAQNRLIICFCGRNSNSGEK